jgi:hypothetical protein
MYRTAFNSDEGGSGRGAARASFSETLEQGAPQGGKSGRALGQSPASSIDRATAEKLSGLLRTFVDLLRTISARFEKGGADGGGTPMPVEPDGGIGDGAGPPPFIVDGEQRFPVEPDGGIGDGAGPPPFEATTLALGEEDGGGSFDPGAFPEDPDGPFPANPGTQGPGNIPCNDIAQYGRRDS